jgi:hypothetical protein
VKAPEGHRSTFKGSMFRGIGAAEKNILAYLGLADQATVSDIASAFPKMRPPTIRRAMRSLAAKGGARLEETPLMTAFSIRSASSPQAAPSRSQAPMAAPSRSPAISRPLWPRRRGL